MRSIIEEKSFNYAKSVITLYNKLVNEKNEYVMSKQLLRCGTSIGANVSEAQDAQSRNDFISKMGIALKESNETKYWLRLLYEMGYISNEDYIQCYNECCEIHKVITSIILSSKNS